MDKLLAEAAIRRIVPARELASRQLGRAVVGISPGLRQSGRSRNKPSRAERRVDVCLDNEALDHDCEKGKERGNAIE